MLTADSQRLFLSLRISPGAKYGAFYTPISSAVPVCWQLNVVCPTSELLQRPLHQVGVTYRRKRRMFMYPVLGIIILLPHHIRPEVISIVDWSIRLQPQIDISAPTSPKHRRAGLICAEYEGGQDEDADLESALDLERFWRISSHQPYEPTQSIDSSHVRL
jgi:hypothetical protein